MIDCHGHNTTPAVGDDRSHQVQVARSEAGGNPRLDANLRTRER